MASHYQIYYDYMQSKYELTPDSEELLFSFDELYNEANEGVILIRRNPLNMKFQMQVFIDMSNIFKERRERALQEFWRQSEIRHPHIFEIDQHYLVLDTPKAPRSLIYFA